MIKNKIIDLLLKLQYFLFPLFLDHQLKDIKVLIFCIMVIFLSFKSYNVDKIENLMLNELLYNYSLLIYQKIILDAYL
jgi:hypothetical protein